jgi:hypothetical protein
MKRRVSSIRLLLLFTLLLTLDACQRPARFQAAQGWPHITEEAAN